MEIPPQLHLEARMKVARDTLTLVNSPDYVPKLMGTIGADPLFGNVRS
jgi:hypothetical protein